MYQFKGVGVKMMEREIRAFADGKPIGVFKSVSISLPTIVAKKCLDTADKIIVDLDGRIDRQEELDYSDVIIGVTSTATIGGCLLERKNVFLNVGDTIKVLARDSHGETITVEVSIDSIKPKKPKIIRCCCNCNNFQYLTSTSNEGYTLPFCVDSKHIKNIVCLQDKNIDTFERDCFVERVKK